MPQHVNDPIAHAIYEAISQYFADLDGEAMHNLYPLVMDRVERPLLEYVLNKSQSNQTLAAEILGINRNTLRKKMKKYDLL